MVFRTHSLFDLLDLRYIQDAKNEHNDLIISKSTILSTYYGHTIFSLFIKHHSVYKHILKKFEDNANKDSN